MEAGIPETQIKMLGRWQSDAYQGYVRTPPQNLVKFVEAVSIYVQAMQEQDVIPNTTMHIITNSI